MPLINLQPGEVMGVGLHVPRGRVVEFRVEAQQSVNAYVVDDEGWTQLRQRKPFVSHGGGLRRKIHTIEGRLPRRPRWHFVIENPQDDPVTLFYEVSF